MARNKLQNRSYLEAQFERNCRLYDLPKFIGEYPFHSYQFDFAIPEIKLGVEIQGGTYIKGGNHVSGAGYERDCKKNNLALLEGWWILRADCKMSGTPAFMSSVRTAVLMRINMRNRYPELFLKERS